MFRSETDRREKSETTKDSGTFTERSGTCYERKRSILSLLRWQDGQAICQKNIVIVRLEKIPAVKP